jgi:hypothetical protein
MDISELNSDPEYNVKYCFTNSDDYTHAILVNTPMPKLTIPKENVIGISFEPVQYLGLTHNFIAYAEQYIGKYLIGNKLDLQRPFVEAFSYLTHMTPLKEKIQNKPKTMSIMISQKTNAPGHQYKHELVRLILKSNLPIDIYGRGCSSYTSVDERIKGGFENQKVMLEDYKYHICIENFRTPHYFSEKIMDSLLSNTIPIYLGCENIEHYFPKQIIHLTGDAVKDYKLIKNICNTPDEYQHILDIDKVKHTISIKRLIENNFYTDSV